MKFITISRRVQAGIVLAGLGAPLPYPGLAAEAMAAVQNPSSTTRPEQADPATKRLMAAHGLFQRGLFKLAAREYADFLSQYPQHPEYTSALYALAICQYRLREFAKASVLLNAVIADQQFADRSEALAVLGHCELVGKNHDKAIAAFDELLAKYPASKHAELAALNRAQALSLAGRHAEAIRACELFIQKHSQSSQRPAALLCMAQSQRAMGNPDQAINILQELAQKFPDSPLRLDAMLLAAQLLESTGKADAAIAQYRQLLSAAPDDRKSEIRYQLGSTLVRASRFAEAIQVLGVIGTDRSPYAQPARLLLGLAQIGAGKIAEARSTLDAIARDDPERAGDAEYGLAQCDMAEKQFEAARVRLKRLAKKQPRPANVAQIALDAAICLMELGRFEEAAAELGTIANDAGAPQRAEAVYRQAFCLHRLGKYDQSHALCEQVSRMPSSDIATAATELDAENLFLLRRYADTTKAFEQLANEAKDPHRRLWYKLRTGQCAYYAQDYAGAAERLAPLAKDEQVSADGELQMAIFLLGDALLQQQKYGQATEALAKFVEVAKGDNTEARYKLSVARLRANDAAGAQQTLAGLVQGPIESPWVQRALVEYGQLAYKAGKPDVAAAALAKVLAIKAPAELAAPAAYLLGWIDFDGKRYTEAADRWKQMAADYPSHPLASDASYQRGVALKEAGRFAEAIAAFESYTTAHPEAANAALARQLVAACLSAQGKNAEAAAILTTLASGSKAGDTVLYDLAWSQRNGNDLAVAIRTYQRLIKEHPESKLIPAARVELSELLYDKAAYAEAAQALEPVVANPPADAKLLSAAMYRLGWSYQKLGKPQKAAEVFTEAATTSGDDELAASASFQAGLAYVEQGKFDKAEQAIAGMLKRFPQNTQAGAAMLKLGEVQAEQGKYEASGQTYSTFLEQFPNDRLAHRAYFGIAWSMESQKKYGEARQTYGRVIAINNGDTAARAQFQIGETFLAEGKFEQAIPALLAVEDVYAYPAWSARALLEAGRAFEQLKQVDQAKQHYLQLISKYKDTPEAAMAQDCLKKIQG